MSESNGAKSIAEVIGQETKTLIERCPEAVDQITGYVEGVAQLINKTIQSHSGQEAIQYLDEICSQLDFVEKFNLAGLPTEMKKHVTMIRNLVKKQILSGEILLERVPMGSKKAPGSIEEAFRLAETKA